MGKKFNLPLFLIGSLLPIFKKIAETNALLSTDFRVISALVQQVPLVRIRLIFSRLLLILIIMTKCLTLYPRRFYLKLQQPLRNRGMNILWKCQMLTIFGRVHVKTGDKIQGEPKQTGIFQTVCLKNDFLGTNWEFLSIWLYEYLLHLTSFHFLDVLLK